MVKTSMVLNDLKDSTKNYPRENWLDPSDIANAVRILVRSGRNGAALVLMRKGLPPMFWPDTAMGQITFSGISATMLNKASLAVRGHDLEVVEEWHIVGFLALCLLVFYLLLKLLLAVFF